MRQQLGQRCEYATLGVPVRLAEGRPPTWETAGRIPAIVSVSLLLLAQLPQFEKKWILFQGFFAPVRLV